MLCRGQCSGHQGHTPCPQKKVSLLYFGNYLKSSPNSKRMVILKSARSEDFKTDLTFDIWPSRSLKKLKTEKNVKTENDPLQGSELGLL